MINNIIVGKFSHIAANGGDSHREHESPGCGSGGIINNGFHARLILLCARIVVLLLICKLMK